MNEDVFVTPTPAAEMKTTDSDIQEITEQIHRLLLQVRRWEGREERLRDIYGTLAVRLFSVISQFTTAAPAAAAASPEPTTSSA